ncbi:MAG: trigger factor [Rikenellaceae bacterium]
MKVTQENLENQVALLKVVVEAADYSDAVDKQLKAARRNANIPGYRKGNVPMGIISKMYRKGATAEEAYRIATNALFAYIQENKIEIIGEPMPSDKQQPLDFDNSTEFEFAFEVGLTSEINIDFSALELKKYEIEPDEEIVDSFKENYLRRFGKLVDKEEVVLDEALTVSLDNDEMNIEDAYVGLISMNDDERAPFIGKKLGDKMEININELYKSASQRAAILSVKEEELEEIAPEFNLTITRIRKFETPELGEELFKEAFEDGSVTNEEEFNEFILTQINSNLEAESSAKMVIDGKEAIIKAAAVSLPEEFLKKWLIAVNEGKFDAETVNNEFPSFVEYASWVNICNRYTEEGELAVTPEELKEEAKMMAAMQFAYYGMANPEEEMLENYATTIVNNKEEARRISESLLTKKCVEYIATKATVNVEKISYKDFAALAQEAKA